MPTPAQYNNFVNGFISDASPENFPENAMSACSNMEVKVDKSLGRRKGLDKVSATQYIDTTNGEAYGDHTHLNLGGTSYLVLLTSHSRLIVVNLTTLATTSTVSIVPSVTAFKGSVTANARGIFVSYSATTTSTYTAFVSYELSSAGILQARLDYNLEMRDLRGTLHTSSYRPPTLATDQKYNLMNQGWFRDVKEYTSGTVGKDVHWFKTNEGVYPSLSDDPNLGVSVNASASSETRFRTQNIVGDAYSTLIDSSKGALTYNPFSTNVTSTLDTSDTTSWSQGQIETYLHSIGRVESSAGYANGLETFSARIFYAGFSSHPDLNGVVLYSPVLTNRKSAGICRQDGDPTSSTAPNPLDTDGGYIVIPEAGRIFDLRVLGSTLLVFASNGVWSISGDGVNSGFTHLSHRVSKVSEIPAFSKASISTMLGSLVYIGVGGIYTIQLDSSLGGVKFNSIIKGKLDTWFRQLSESQKINSKVTFDPEVGILYMLFVDKILVLRLSTGSFYLFDITSTVPVEVGVSLPNLKVYPITTSNNNYPLGYTKEEIPYGAIFFVDGYACSFINPQYIDYGSTTPYVSSVSIGAYNFKDLYRTKQVFRLISDLERTESISHTDVNGDVIIEDESSCLVRPVWDYSTSSLTGKIGKWFQTYASVRFVSFGGNGDSYDYKIHTTKRRLRGSGRALQLDIKSEGNKHLELKGYVLEVEGRQR